jgi:hypothetical protein
MKESNMKRLIAGLVALGAAAAFATETGDAGEVKVRSLEVQDRLQVIELINVTAEKPLDEATEPLDGLLLEIMNEANALDAPEA